MWKAFENLCVPAKIYFAIAILSIIFGLLSKKWNIYHPHHKVYPAVVINFLFPSLMEYIFKMIMVRFFG